MSWIYVYNSQHLLWFLTEEEAMVEFGLIEAAADDADGTVVRSAVIVSPKFKELSLTGHVLSERLKTWPNRNKINIHHLFMGG